MDFTDAQRIVAARLTEQFADQPQRPTVQPYGFDTGRAWAPKITWNGVMGVFVYLVDKTTGALTPLSFPDFADMPDPKRVGRWPANT
jgi:hypothetical protein